MKITLLSEMITRYYYSGRVKVSNMQLSQRDFLQYAKTAWASLMRQMYYENKKMGDGEEYYFYSSDLLTISFKLGESDCRGKRRLDMIGYDLFRLPKNSHIQNVYPVNCKGCETREIVQVQPGEENFYLNDPKMSFFQFFVVKGRGLDTYNIPSCVSELNVESIFDSNDLEVSLDMAFDIFKEVLKTAFELKAYPINPQDDSFDPQARLIKQALSQEKPIQ